MKRQKREGEFTAIPEKERLLARRLVCAKCHRLYGSMIMSPSHKLVVLRQCIDHVVPRRFCSKIGVDPHRQPNLESICQICHSSKLRLEDHLFRGNAYDFVRGLARLGWPATVLLQAGKYCGLPEIQKLCAGLPTN